MGYDDHKATAFATRNIVNIADGLQIFSLLMYVEDENKTALYGRRMMGF